MKRNLFNVKVLGGMLVSAAVALASCSDDLQEGNLAGSGDNTPAKAKLTTATLAVSQSNQARVRAIEAEGEDESVAEAVAPGTLQLIAEIENPSKEEGFMEVEGRFLSATCVYYDASTETFYTTYHMQGNNYNTTQEVETAGMIETFKLDTEGQPVLEEIYRSANPEKLDFDFNHLYFDDLSDWTNCGLYKGTDTGVRFIAVGHSSEPTKDGTGYNTKAIIAKLNLEEGKIEYSPVLTGEKLLDEEGKSLGDIDAGDVNCVLRKYDYYYLATRKGIAVLNAKPENLFTPINNLGEDFHPVENSTYFVKTPGSAKHFSHIWGNGSHFSLLYLTENTPAGFDGTTALPASIINFSMNAGDGTLCGSTTTDSQTDGKAIFNTTDFDITTWSPNVNQSAIPYMIYPVDGKNVLATPSYGRTYACLGKSGLYVKKTGNSMDGPYADDQIVTFRDKKDVSSSRSVNGVYIEDIESHSNGYIYVANGACVTILEATSLKKIAEYSAFEEGKEVSANYVHVVKTDNYTNPNSPDRIVTVAYGQDGVKVFRFTPVTWNDEEWNYWAN